MSTRRCEIKVWYKWILTRIKWRQNPILLAVSMNTHTNTSKHLNFNQPRLDGQFVPRQGRFGEVANGQLMGNNEAGPLLNAQKRLMTNQWMKESIGTSKHAYTTISNQPENRIHARAHARRWSDGDQQQRNHIWVSTLPPESIVGCHNNGLCVCVWVWIVKITAARQFAQRPLRVTE